MATNDFTFHYVHPGEVIAIGATLPALGIIFVALRFYNRITGGHKLGLDDWLILGGLVYSLQVVCLSEYGC